MLSQTAAKLAPPATFGLAAGIGRREAFLWLGVFLLANQALLLVDTRSFAAFGASLAAQNYVYWLACYAVMFRLYASDGARRANRGDICLVLAMGVAILISSFVAHRSAIGLLATTTAAYLLVGHGGDRQLRAAGGVLLALAGHLVWAPVVFQFFTPELLRADAALVGGIITSLRPDVVWNGTSFHAPDGHSITLIGGCSSFNNVSTAVLACATIAMLTRAEWVRRDIATIAIASAVMILANTLRLSAFASSSALHLYWHDGAGAQIFAIIQTIAVLAIAWWGAAPRRRGA